MTNGSATWSYTYNNDGMRVKRTNGSTTYTYYYNGNLLRYLDINGTKLYFVLDANGQPLEVSYQPAGTSGIQIYYFVMNLQGDVTAIVDTSGNPVVQYSYDAWGNILSTTGSMANTLGAQNPFRYRGYVYDHECGLYYLQSRYYDPELGRFINADAFTSTGQGIIGNNMFAYCGNNPVISADHNGEWFTLVIGAAAGALISGVTTWLNGGNKDEIIVSAVCGAFSGILAAAGVGGVAGQMIIGAVSSAVDSGYQNYNDYKEGKITMREAVASTLVDTAMGATFGAMGFEGTDALDVSELVSGQTIDALKTLGKKGLHPSVKSAAKATLRAGKKYIANEIKSTIVDNVLTSAFGFGVGKTAEVFY